MLPNIQTHVVDFTPNGAGRRPPPLPPQMPQQQQQPQAIGSMQLSPLTEEKFMDMFMLFSHATGLRLNEQDFNIEGHQVNPWDLHRMVFARNGFDSVTANDEWPVVGTALGFPPLLSDSVGNPTGGQTLVSSPAIGLRLQQLYQATLRHFDQVYVSSTQARSLQTSAQAPPQPPPKQAELPRPAEVDHGTLLVDAPLEASPLTSEMTCLLPPQFSGTPDAELGMTGTPQRIIASVEQNREHSQHLAHSQNGFYAGIGSRPENAQLAAIARLSQAFGDQGVVHPSVRSIPNYRQQLPPQQVFCAQVPQRAMTQQQGRQRFATTQVTPHHIQVLPEQNFSQKMSNQNSPLQLVVQLQDPSHAHQFSALLPQGQPQHNGPGYASHMRQNLNHSGMGPPQRQVSLQESFVQSSLGETLTDIQFSSMPSTLQAHPPPGQQFPVQSIHFADLPLPQFRTIYAQMIHTWMEGEKRLQASGTSGDEGDIQRRQQLRLNLDTYKQRILALQEFINNKARASGDLSQLVNGPSWLGQAQWPAGLYPESERSGQYNSHSPQQALVNQVTQRDFSISQQSLLATAQSNSTQRANDLPQRPWAIQPHNIPPVPEGRFESVFMRFSAAMGLRLTERDLVIEGQPVNLWALHKAVFMQNGFESVCTKDEWPIIGVTLGFPVFSGGDDGQPARCAPAVAHRLQQLYNDVLRQFDQAYISCIVRRFGASSQMASQPYRPTEADYRALLVSASPESPIITPGTMSLLPRFSDACVAELAAHRVPQHIIAFVEQNRGHLKRAAQDRGGYLAGLMSTKNTYNRTQVNQGSALPTMACLPQVISGYQEHQTLQRQTMIQGTIIQSSTAQPMHVSNVPLRGAQIGTSSSEAQNHGGVMSEPMKPDGVNSVTCSPFIHHSVGPMQMRKPSPEELIVAKRWVDEQRKIAFSREIDEVADDPGPTIPECDTQEYRRNLERLDQVLSNIEEYMYIAFAVLKKEDVVERLFFMMANTRAQREELEKPHPRYLLELCNIRGMIQEADNMDKGLRVVLGFNSPTPWLPMPSGRIPFVPQPQPMPLSMGVPRPIAELTPPAAVQGDESGPPPEEATSDLEDLFNEEVMIAMDKLRI